MKRISSAYRWVIVFVFTVVLILLLISLAKRNNVSTQLQENITDFNKNDRYISLIDSSIYQLLTIENNLQLYTVTKKQDYYLQYVSSLNRLTGYIDSLERILSVSIPDSYDKGLDNLVKQKKDKAKAFIHLRSVNDSLIILSTEISKSVDIHSINFGLLPVEINRLDSVVIVSNTKTKFVPVKTNKNLLGRLKDAIINKESEYDTLQTTNNNEEHIVKSNTNSVQLNRYRNQQKIKQYNSILRGAVKRLIATHEKLKNKEAELFVTNNKLLSKLSNSFKELKELEDDNIESKKLEVEATKNIGVLTQVFDYVLIISIILAVITLFNIWYLFQNEQKLKKAKEVAVRQTKIKTDLLAQMSHEIRTPLNSILGFTEQLESSVLSVKQQGNLDAVKRASQILLSIVNDILDLSKIETGKLTIQSFPFFPKRTIEDIVSTLKIHADKKGLELIVNYSFTEELKLYGDEFRLKQVTINLINNAIKYTKTGSVTINVDIMPQCILKVEVIDTGIGIAKENIDDIFNEFMQIINKDDTNRHNGTGLGLTICKKIVEAQKGKIGVESELGKGSRFYFEIPYLNCSEVEGLVDIAQTGEEHPIDINVIKDKRILIVDDNKMNRLLLKVIFNKWGIEYDEAEDGLDALRLFSQKEYHIILTDIQMPNMDGLGLAKEIRKQSSLIPVVAVTANTIESDERHYKEAGINDVLVKPFKESTLYNKIRKYV